MCIRDRVFTLIDTGGYVIGGDDSYEKEIDNQVMIALDECCLLYTSPSPRDVEESRMPSSA